MKSINKIFYTNNPLANDYHIILNQYLESKGFLVIKNKTYNVAFREGPSSVSLLNVIQSVAAMHGLSVLEISQAQEDKY